jgi:hypothetical protein
MGSILASRIIVDGNGERLRLEAEYRARQSVLLSMT